MYKFRQYKNWCLILCLCLSGCVYYPCQVKTAKAIEQLGQEGYLTRIGHGFYKGEPHRWAEYFDDRNYPMRWKIIDNAIKSGINNYKERKDCSEYEVIWYE